jgi:K+-sensing histidine kinase KdpD
MGVLRSTPGKRVLPVLVSLLIAGGLVAAVTLARAALSPQLGALSPFMLYIAAVVVAGMVRGPLCGVLVILGGGACGMRFFLNPYETPREGALLSLIIFCMVSTLVLVTANELRVHLKLSMDRLAAALARHRGGPTAGPDKL